MQRDRTDECRMQNRCCSIVNYQFLHVEMSLPFTMNSVFSVAVRDGFRCEGGGGQFDFGGWIKVFFFFANASCLWRLIIQCMIAGVRCEEERFS